MSDKPKKIIEKLWALSEKQKLIIIFTVVIFAGLVLGFFWVKDVARSIETAGQAFKSAQLPNIDIPKDVTDALPDLKNTVSDATEPATVDNLKSADVPPVTSPTADWKTYTDSKYAFEIKYPTDWMEQENAKSLQYSLMFCQDNKDGCVAKRLTQSNKDEIGPMYLFVLKPGTEKPTDPNNHYLATDALKNDYYLFSEFPKNETTTTDMIATFKFTN